MWYIFIGDLIIVLQIFADELTYHEFNNVL